MMKKMITRCTGLSVPRVTWFTIADKGAMSIGADGVHITVMLVGGTLVDIWKRNSLVSHV